MAIAKSRGERERLPCFWHGAPPHLLRHGRSAPAPGHQIDVRPRFEERIRRGFDPLHAWNRIEDDVLLRLRIVRRDLRQSDFTERQLRTAFGPTDGGVVGGIAVLGQLHGDTKTDRN